MIDTEAVALVQTVQANLAGMTDARPSQLLAAKEKFGEAFLAILRKAGQDITTEQKVALFDRLLQAEVGHYASTIEKALEGDGYFLDDDHEGATYEEVVQGTLGPRIYEALNELEDLLTGI